MIKLSNLTTSRVELQFKASSNGDSGDGIQWVPKVMAGFQNVMYIKRNKIHILNMNSIKENSNRFFSKGLSKSMWAPFVALQTFLSTHDEEHQV